MEKTVSVKTHSLSLEQRRKMRVSGVAAVSGYDEQTVELRLDSAVLVISGEKLNITNYSADSGDLQLEGEISDIRYTAVKDGDRRFISRLFK